MKNILYLFLTVLIFACNYDDEIGKSVKSFKRKVFTGNNKLELNIDDLKPAIYFASIKLGNELIHKQIIKK